MLFASKIALALSAIFVLTCAAVALAPENGQVNESFQVACRSGACD